MTRNLASVACGYATSAPRHRLENTQKFSGVDVIALLSSTFGRWLRIVVGLVLLIAGFCLGPWGSIACVVGVIMMAAGASDVCLLAPLFGGKVAGSANRR